MFIDITGQKVPDVSFPIIVDGDWILRNSDDIFTNKTVIVFSLPGAFTPTCSSYHLPHFNALAPKFFENGVDEIICMSVNDTFVMNAWAQDQNADNISFLPDGNGEFTEGMGLLVDKGEIGFGKRSWRYAMLVKNGIIEKMFIEPDLPGDPFEVSDAETMLNFINPKAVQKTKIAMFTKRSCSHCIKAKGVLAEQGLQYEELVIDENTTLAAMQAITSASSTPQVFIDGKLIGGNDELTKYFS